MSKTIGIAGSGVAGRMLALACKRRGWDVSLFDRDDESGRLSCTWTGAGMLAPYCELETAEAEVSQLGIDSLTQWPALIAGLAAPVFFQQRGSLVVAHPADDGELTRLRDEFRRKSGDAEAMREVTGDDLGALEPELAGRFLHGLHFPREAQLDNRELLDALAATIKREGIAWHTGANVQRVEKGRLNVSNDWKTFDQVADCRGLGARDDLKNLRGVRGELLYVRAPDVTLNRPVRMMHPRYPLYIVPRPDHVFVVGATKVESDDLSPITVRSALELLTAAYAVHPAFAEGRIEDTSVNCRPAFPDNKPRAFLRDGVLHINGLYRHGFLVTPGLVTQAMEMIT
jgi:glycine oxidase